MELLNNSFRFDRHAGILKWDPTEKGSGMNLVFGDYIQTSALLFLDPLSWFLFFRGCLSPSCESCLLGCFSLFALTLSAWLILPQFKAQVQSGWWPTTRSKVGREVVLVMSLKPKEELRDGLSGAKLSYPPFKPGQPPQDALSLSLTACRIFFQPRWLSSSRLSRIQKTPTQNMKSRKMVFSVGLDT